MFHHGYRDKVIIRLFFFFRLTVENVHPTRDLSRQNVTELFNLSFIRETKNEIRSHKFLVLTHRAFKKERVD